MGETGSLCLVTIAAGVLIFSGEILAATAVSGPGGPHAPGQRGVSRLRCFEVCADGTACKQSVCYESTAEKCHFSVMGATDLVPTPGVTQRNASCTYDKSGIQECASTYHRTGTEEQRVLPLFPLPPFDGEFFLDFAVQASADAILSLSTNGTYSGIRYELVLGMAGNKYTSIRRRWNGATLKKLSTEGGVLSAVEMRRFWLRYDHGTFALGKHRQRAYLEWADPTPPAQPVQYIGLGSWYKVVDWKLYDVCPVGPVLAGRASCCVPVECNNIK